MLIVFIRSRRGVSRCPAPRKCDGLTRVRDGPRGVAARRSGIKGSHFVSGLRRKGQLVAMASQGPRRQVGRGNPAKDLPFSRSLGPLVPRANESA